MQIIDHGFSQVSIWHYQRLLAGEADISAHYLVVRHHHTEELEFFPDATTFPDAKGGNFSYSRVVLVVCWIHDNGSS